MSIPNLSLAREMASAYQRQPAVAAPSSQAEAKFQVQATPGGTTGQGTQSIGAAGHAAGATEPAAVEPSKGAMALTELLKPTKATDPVKLIDQVRARLREALSEGGGSISMAELLNLQLLAQDATRTLELTTKVAEHATSGVKTVLQTQA